MVRSKWRLFAVASALAVTALPGAEALAAGSAELTVEGRWLMLPVQNGGRKYWTEVRTADGVFQKFEMELAEQRVDWYAVLDVASLKGRKIEVVPVKEYPADGVGLKGVKTSDDAPAPDGYAGRYRPQFHFSPCRGWMNDPNGLSYFNGEWHVFFQHNPYGVKWGNMHWGHAVSKDLFHWREVGEALYPDKLGMMFSGSAVVDKDNTAGFGKNAHVLIYTATANGSTQCIAYSHDGRNYIKYDGNPVLPNVAGGNRDPRVFWHEPTKRWVMALFVDRPERHTIGIFNSPDLKHWEQVSVIPGDKHGGSFLSECPELFELPIEGEQETRWLVMGASGEFALGTFDGKTFVPDGPRFQMARVMGGGFYAAQTFGDLPDGRRIMMPWIHTKMPGMPFSQCYGLPFELSLRRTPDGLRVVRQPVREVKSLRKGAAKALKDFNGELAEVFVDLRIPPAADVVISLRGHRIQYRGVHQILSMPGGNIGWPLENGRLRFHCFIDRVTLETFSMDGLRYICSGNPQTDPDDRSISIVEGAHLVLEDRSRVYELESAW